jgi:hypothetical protein
MDEKLKARIIAALAKVKTLARAAEDANEADEIMAALSPPEPAPVPAPLPVEVAPAPVVAP